MDDAVQVYLLHRVLAAPRRWNRVAQRMRDTSTELASRGGRLFGIWRSQIGRPRDELTAITAWRSGIAPGVAKDSARTVFGTIEDVAESASRVMFATLRPRTDEAPTRQGNYAFRYFETPSRHWEEFLSLCAQAWPGFESAYDSQVIGLWRLVSDARNELVESLLLTRRPDLAMWERSKQPQGEAEVEVRQALSRRYDLCDSTVVYTSTLLTARDRDDTTRWT